MDIRPFALERYFDEQDELNIKYLLSASDPETLRMETLLALADPVLIELWRNLRLGYTESQGHPLLRKEVSNLYSDVITPGDVLICTPPEGIFIAMHAILNQDDAVIVTCPGYQSLYEIAVSLGCGIIPWTPYETAWHFDTDLLRIMKKVPVKLLVMNFPHNPTGALLSRGTFDETIAFARENDAYIFSDEMYRFLEYDPSKRLPSVSEVYERGISLCGMSKVFGLAGLRIGWLTTQDQELFQRLVRFKDYISICSSGPSEILAIIALRVRDIIIERNLGIIKENLGLLRNFFAAHAGLFSWVEPAGGTVAFPKLNSKISIDRLCADLLKSKGTLLVPGSKFQWPGNRFRIGLGRKNFPEALAKFEEYLLETHLI